MKSNAHLSLPLQRQAAPQRRWWLGWLQLLCAWLLCMLLCANVALVLAEGLPQDDDRAAARKPADCTLWAEAAAGPGPASGESVARTLRRIPRCSGS